MFRTGDWRRRNRRSSQAALVALAMVCGLGLSLSAAGGVWATPGAQVPLKEDRPWECRPDRCSVLCAVDAQHAAHPEVLLAEDPITVAGAMMFIPIAVDDG